MSCLKFLLAIFSSLALCSPLFAENWIHLSGNSEVAKNKQIVFVTGDDEYKSEQSMPLMAHILAEQHGFDCTVLFAIDRKSGVINTSQRDNIPGLEALEDADLMVIYTRFRELEDAQCAMIEAYLASGKPVIGVRTATHAFNFLEKVETGYRHFNYNHKGDDMPGGFGNAVLGETWISHWGHHGTEGTLGVPAPSQENHPILKGVEKDSIYGPTDVYTVELPLPEGCQPIVLGQVTATLEPDSGPTKKLRGTVEKNEPMMPVSWTWQRPVGAKGRVFTSTVGGDLRGTSDWASEGMRRMFVNACYWTMGIEAQIPNKPSVDLPFTLKDNPYKRGVKPAAALAKVATLAKPTPAVLPAKPTNILFYGNSMVERLLEHGELEARLQITRPEAGLKIRSLAWTGDEVGNRLRLEKYAKHMKKLIAEWPADTLVLGYGLFESFAGQAGLAEFQQQYRDHIRQLQQVHPGAKIVLLSPTAIEGADADRQAEVALYTKAISDLAEEVDADFISLFAPTSDAFAASVMPLTTGGIHFNNAGNAVIAATIAEALGATTEVDPDHLAEVALAAAAKQKRVAEIVRPKNAVVYFGVRERPDEYNAEMPRYHEMIRRTEAVVHELAATPGKAFADVPVPSLEPMGPGKGRDDGPKTGIIKTVAENQAEFTVADGYEVNLFASEEEFPELRNPVQIAFDARGRLWVVTMPSFPHTVPGLTPPDKILILEDTDRDGKADKVTTYMEGLDALDGIAFHHDGVIISEQPRLWMTRDTDGNDQTDFQTELLRGIDVTDSHHGGMILSGPMGDISFCDGVFHRSQLETPFGVHRGIDATTYRLDPTTGRINSEWQHITPNPWNVAFDRWGQQYQMYGDGGVFDGVSLVWTPRGSYHPYGYAQLASYGKGSGMAITSSPNFPDSFQQGFVSASLLGRYAVNMTTMNFDTGMAKTGEHITLLSSPNAAFRPADLEFGMDGALYVSDFCSPIIGHAQHPMRDPHWDHDYGRIWRIVNKDKPLVKDWPQIEGAAPYDLAMLLTSPTDLVRHHARIELRKHGAEGLAVLDQWFRGLDKSGRDYDQLALEVVFVAAGLGEARPALIDQLLVSEDPLYRGAAIHTLRVQADLYPEVRERLAKMTSDPHPRVQNQLIGAIIHLRQSDPTFEELLAHISPATPQVEKTLSYVDLGTEPMKKRSVPVLTVDPASQLTQWLRYSADGSGTPVAHSSKKPSGGGDHLYRTFVHADEPQSAILAINCLNLEVRVNGVTKFRQVSFWSADQQVPVELEAGENTIEVILLKGRRAAKKLPPVFLYDPVGNALAGTRYPSDSKAVLASAKAYAKAQSERDKTIRIQAAAELQFAQKEITVTAGKSLQLVFENPDVMLHNFLLIKPGTLDKVGALADAMAADPKAAERHYVPDTEDVLLSSTLLGPGAEETLEFTAPDEPGIYPYICTFPGHWRLMKGEMKVVPAAPKPSENQSFETANNPVGFKTLIPSDMVSGKVTASQKTNNDPLATLADGKLSKGFGPIFGNGVKDGAYCLDLGESKAISSVTSWSYNQGGKRGVQKIQVYGSNHPKSPGWNLSDTKRFTPLGTVSTEGYSTKAFTAVSLRPEKAKSFGYYRWIVWQVAPVTKLEENTAFQELRVEVGE